MEWAVLNWNEPAIKFYRALGAKPMDEWTVFRLTPEEIAKLADAVDTAAHHRPRKTLLISAEYGDRSEKRREDARTRAGRLCALSRNRGTSRNRIR